MPAVGFLFVAVAGQEAGPGEALGDGRRFIEQRAGLLIGHFEEEQERELFDVVTVGEAVIPKDVALVPEFVDELGCCVTHWVIKAECGRTWHIVSFCGRFRHKRVDARGRSCAL